MEAEEEDTTGMGRRRIGLGMKKGTRLGRGWRIWNMEKCRGLGQGGKIMRLRVENGIKLAAPVFRVLVQPKPACKWAMDGLGGGSSF